MLEFVPFTEAHLPIFAAWFRELPGNSAWTDEWVRRRTLDSPTCEPALMIAALQNGEPVGFALGSMAEGNGWVQAFLTHPGRRRQGIGTAMFDLLERRFAERGAKEIIVGYALPRYLLPGVDIHYTPAVVFLYERDYKTNRECRVNMDVMLAGRDFDTARAEERLQARGIAVRRGRSEDRAELVRFCEASGHKTWAIETSIALENDPSTVFVAVQEGRICAFAAHSVCGPIHFGPMLTAPELRGQGIGSVLLKRCLQDWQRAGQERCEITWAGPLAFYARAVGATVGRAFWVFRKGLQPPEQG